MFGIDWSSWQLLVAIIAGVVTSIVGFTTLFWRRLQKRSFVQNQQFQSDTHIFQLCKALSDPSPRLQMAAAALLLERLHNMSSEREQNAIIQALLAATIDDRSKGTQPAASSEFCKYVADSVIEVLKRSKAYGSASSPLARYYWQRVRCPGAYWAGVDLREVDLFGSTLDGASLRRANLRKTILYDASLRGAKLLGADLTGADLRGANLCRADLSDQEADEKGPAAKTQWAQAKFAGARYDDDTRFPTGLDPKSLGMILADAAAERLAS
jgi:hypothetical protein